MVAQFFTSHLMILVLLCNFYLLSSCRDTQHFVDQEPNYSQDQSLYLSGMVTPFLGLFVKKSFKACLPSDVNVSLYHLDENGDKEETPLQTTTLDDSATYYFPINQLNLTSYVDYVVEVIGCNEHYSRAITDLDENQNINAITTIAAYIINAETTRSFRDINRESYKSFIEKLSGASTEIVIFTIDSTPSLKSEFEDLFSTSSIIDKLKETTPIFKLSSIPATINEKVSTLIEVETFHFNTLYDLGVEWHVNEVNQTTFQGNTSFDYEPGPNEQGLKEITLYLGTATGDATIGFAVNRDKPYISETFSLSVLDSSPATPPDFISTTGATIFTSQTINLELLTTVGLSECETFSMLGFSIGSSSTSSEAVFDIICTPATQAISGFDLGSTEEEKIIKLWAKDSSNNISSIPSTISVTFDKTPPVISATFPTVVGGGISHTLYYTVSDNLTGVSNVKFYVSTDGINYSYLGNAAGSSSSFAWTTPVAGSVIAKFVIQAFDIAGNMSELISPNFTVDVTAPNVTITSPASLSNHTTSFTLEGTCDSTSPHDVFITGVGGDPISTFCSGNVFSQVVTLEYVGNNVVIASQQDEGGNLAQDSRTFILSSSKSSDLSINELLFTQNLVTGKSAIHPFNQNTFLIIENEGIYKVDAVNGLMEKFIGHGNVNLADEQKVDSTTHKVNTKYTTMNFDFNGLLYLSTSDNSHKDAVIYQIDTYTNKIKTYLGGGLINDNTATPSTVNVLNTQFAFDEDNSLYFATECVPNVSFDTKQEKEIRILKASQDFDNSANLIDVIAGSCSSVLLHDQFSDPQHDPLSYPVIISKSAQDLHEIFSIAVWERGNKILFCNNEQLCFKIENDKLYYVNRPQTIDSTDETKK